MDALSEGFDLDIVLNAGSDAPADQESPEPDDSPEPETDQLDASADAPAADSSETAATEPEPAAPQYQPLDWNHPELAAVRQQFQEIQPKLQFLDQVQSRLAEAQSLQARQEIEQTLIELADGDMDRHSKILGTIASLTQPLTQQAHQTEQRATGAEKQLAAFVLATEAHLTPEQRQTIKANFDDLMAADNPQVMAKLAGASVDAQSKYNPVIAAQQQKIAELEKRIAAKATLDERRATGAGRVDNGGQPQGAGVGSDGKFSLHRHLGWED